MLNVNEDVCKCQALAGGREVCVGVYASLKHWERHGKL